MSASPPNRPSALELYVETSDGRALHRTPVLYVDDYDLEKIKEKELVFLPPYLLFRHASELEAIEADGERIGDLKEEFEELRDYCLELRRSGRLDGDQLAKILKITRRVSDNLAANHKVIRKEVGEIMGGDVWTLEVDKIRNEAAKQIADKDRQLEDKDKMIADAARQLGDKDKVIAAAAQALVRR